MSSLVAFFASAMFAAKVNPSMNSQKQPNLCYDSTYNQLVWHGIRFDEIEKSDLLIVKRALSNDCDLQPVCSLFVFNGDTLSRDDVFDRLNEMIGDHYQDVERANYINRNFKGAPFHDVHVPCEYAFKAIDDGVSTYVNKKSKSFIRYEFELDFFTSKNKFDNFSRSIVTGFPSLDSIQDERLKSFFERNIDIVIDAYGVIRDALNLIEHGDLYEKSTVLKNSANILDACSGLNKVEYRTNSEWVWLSQKPNGFLELFNNVPSMKVKNGICLDDAER